MKTGKVAANVPGKDRHSAEFDWLAYALGKIGDHGKSRAGENLLQAAARELGVTRQRIISWLEKGIGHLTFSQVADLADRAGVPVDMLKSRCGPHDYSYEEDDKAEAGN
jgi:hypothetical protein